MRYLLEVNWAAIDPRLVSFSKDGIERLLHGHVNHGPHMNGSDDVFELLFWVL